MGHFKQICNTKSLQNSHCNNIIIVLCRSWTINFGQTNLQYPYTRQPLAIAIYADYGAIQTNLQQSKTVTIYYSDDGPFSLKQICSIYIYPYKTITNSICLSSWTNLNKFTAIPTRQSLFYIVGQLV